MTKYRRVGLRAARRRFGRKRSRVKVGLRVFVFLLAAAVMIGACAIAVNIDLEDRIVAWQKAQASPQSGKPDRTVERQSGP